MDVALTTTPLEQVRADLLVVPIGDPPARSPLFTRLDRAMRGRLRREAERIGWRGQPRQELWLQNADGSALPSSLLLVGAGSRPGVAFWYEVADALANHATRLRARRAAVALGESASPAVLTALVEGVALARYRFTRYRSRPEAAPALALTIAVPAADAELRRAVDTAAVAAAAASYARDLANTPAADLSPAALAGEARRVARRGLSVRVHDHRALARLGMGALLGVGQGSARAPCFIEMAYVPRGARRRVALVGKGITFDSGGLSLKTADAMQTQKRDMAGAAVVLAVMAALPALRLPVEVRGYMPAAENMPSGTAIRPGDVLRACNGTTIEVLNTDAEGRLVLADALAYAARARPDLMLDFATLTAAVRATFGPRCAAVLGTDRALVAALIAAGAEANELLWELPLLGEYRHDLDSRIADLKNVGEGHAGTIVAALFLREFVGAVPWAHVDFSSTVMSDGYPCHPKGATGFGVRTVLRYLTSLAAHAPAARRRARLKR